MATITASSGSASGSADITVAQVAVAASITPGDSVYKSATQLIGSAVDAMGSPVPGSGVMWESLTPSILTIDQSGNISPVSTGVGLVRITADGFVDSATVRMVWNVQQLSDLFPLHNFNASIGGRTVYSDLSQAHADQHMGILDDAWNHLAALLTGTGLTMTDFYFTSWAEIWVEYSPFCGGVLLQNQTLWQRCVSPFPLHFLTPEQNPDSRNIVRFLSHEFLRFAYAEADAFPWLKEGFGHWNGSGMFDAGGQLTVAAPEAILITDFQNGDSQNNLEALDSLTQLASADYYAGIAGRTPVAVRNAQSTMFFAYLALNHPTAIANLYTGINNGTVTTNALVLASILADTGMTISALETAYLAYARSL